MLSHDGNIDEDVRSHMKSTWCKWKELREILYDNNMTCKLKSTVYENVVRPAVMYGSECWLIRKIEEQLFHVPEMRMLGWMLGKIRAAWLCCEMV